MKTYNRFIAFSKRILYHKAYLLMLCCLIALTITYRLLPDSSKSTDISAAIYFEEESSYSESLKTELANMHSIYNFIYTDTRDELISLVKSGSAECGYAFPKEFFNDYINGIIEEHPVEVYVIPATTLSGTIGESIFSNIIEITAEDILLNTVDNPELNDELSSRLYEYMNGDTIFTLSSSLTGEFDFRDMVYKIDLPVYELNLLFLIISSLLGLLLFQRDVENNMFITFSPTETALLKLIAIVTAVIPIFLTGSISIIITYGIGKRLAICPAVAAATTACAWLTGLVIKKSTLLSKVLPLTAFAATIVIFLINLI